MLKDIKVKRILFAADFLESSRLALEYATAIAHYFKATLVMLNVIELSQAGLEAEMGTRSPCMTRLYAQKRLDALAAGVRANEVLTETHVQNGVPWECILASVVSYHADMLVLAVHGIHTGLGHLLVGSNTERILMSADCPTLAVGAHAVTGVELGFHPKENFTTQTSVPPQWPQRPMLYGSEGVSRTRGGLPAHPEEGQQQS